ncbi:hypothetical protein ACEPAH_9309 [Sanghuangporus vaninii]
MDPNLYRNFTTSRGYRYRYYYHTASKVNKPTLLLLHGFPSTSADWTRVVVFFLKEGYGILVPDLLGYGGTDKPTDQGAYRLKKMAKDIVEILDTEKLEKVVSISHDWGSGLNSRLLTYHRERILASAFFAVGYYPPSGSFDIDALNAASIAKNGYAKFGYWKFFSKDGAENITLDHLESLFTLLYSSDDSLTQHWCPEGALEEWLLADKKSSQLIISEEEKRFYIDFFSKNGFAGPFCWYKATVFNLNAADEADIPQDAFFVKQPVFFGATLRDPTSIPAEYIGIIKALCPNHTIRSFETGHWVLHERPTEVNEELKNWLDGLRLEGPKTSNL